MAHMSINTVRAARNGSYGQAAPSAPAPPALVAPVDNGENAKKARKIWAGVNAAASYIPWWGWAALGAAAVYGSPFGYRYVKKRVGAKFAKRFSSGGDE